MDILITGTNSGIGKELSKILTDHNVLSLTRTELDLSNISDVLNYNMPKIDILINMAATDVGGKIIFDNHDAQDIVTTLNTNLMSPILLSQKALKNNINCKIVNITSTNNKRYYQNNLIYSITKKSLTDFTNFLQIEYPNIKTLEIRLGLTKTNFNKNRYKNHMDRYQEIYQNPHLSAEYVASVIHKILFDDKIKFIEISP